MKRSGTEEDFEHLEYPPPNLYITSEHLEAAHGNDNPETVRTPALNSEDYKKFFDPDGRLVDEHGFRKAVFRGGVSPDIRADAWKFLFCYYPCHSTRREREVLAQEQKAKYLALKTRWKEELEKHLESGLATNEDNLLKGSHEVYSPNSPVETLGTEDTQFASIQAQVFAGRQSLNVNSLIGNIRAIDKDVPRTDRKHPYFMGHQNPHLKMLRNILVTFAAYHSDVGYAQGMNDITSRFLMVLDSEIEAYWCFTNFMDKIQVDFLEEGMVRKLETLRYLLQRIDPDLYYYLSECEVQDMTFCHRWLLLSFQREFDYLEGLKLFEILSSHYLELNSLEAEKTKEISRRKNFEKEGGRLQQTYFPEDLSLTFELFFCIAVLLENRVDLFACLDSVSVFQCVNSCPKKLSLEQFLIKAEQLFYAYCQKSVIESFEVIEMPVKPQKKWWVKK